MARHLESDSDFERELFAETIRRITYIRRVGFQTKRTKWFDWLAPISSAAVIAIVYYVYIFPKF
jgi:hypothetical protein